MAVLLAAFLPPDNLSWVTRGLLVWNLSVWRHLILVAVMMAGADHLRLRRIAVAQAEGAPDRA